MKLLLLGGNDRTLACLRRLHHAGETFALALDKPYSPLQDEAAHLGVPAFLADHPSNSECLTRLASEGASLWVMAGYTKRLPEAAISLPPLGVWNLHAGRVPAYRGASVLNWQIMEGETHIGLSILQTDAGLDTGPVLAETCLPIGPDDTIADIQARVLVTFPEMLLDTLAKARAGCLLPRTQPAAGRTWPKRHPADGVVCWTSSARRLHDFIRALTHPYPGAFTWLNGTRLTLWKSRVLEETSLHLEPGRLLRVTPEGADVATMRGTLRLLEYDGEATLRVGQRLTEAP